MDELALFCLCFDLIKSLNEFTEKNRIEIAFQFWKFVLKREKSGKNIILIVSAQELIITENQDQAWNEIFGNEYDDLYEYFKGQFDSKRYVSDYTECLKLIDEYEQNPSK